MDELAHARINKRIEDTWEELGCRIRPRTWYLFVRTEHKPYKTHSGLIYLPPKAHTFHGPMAHVDLLKGIVCAAGPIAQSKSRIEVGRRIIFKRLHFAWWKKMEDGTRFGWIPSGDVLGYPYDDEDTDQRSECIQHPTTAKAAGYAF